MSQSIHNSGRAWQAMTTDPRQRAKMVHDFERHALTEAYTVPLLWWNRIVATSSKLRGWSIISSHRTVTGGGGERGTTIGRRIADESRTAP
jgi:hypothetical protein